MLNPFGSGSNIDILRNLIDSHLPVKYEVGVNFSCFFWKKVW